MDSSWIVTNPAVAAAQRATANTSGGTACGSGSFPFPYTDVGPVGDAFCPGILQAYVLGVTKGTSLTTFSPNDPVNRVQMTTFLQRSLDQGLKRSSRRAALNQWWTPQSTQGTRALAIGGASRACASDGDSIWVPVSGSVLQLQAGSGKLVGTWTGATGSGNGVVVAAGKVFVSGLTSGGQLHAIDPTQPAGPVSTVSTNLGDNPGALAFDGARLWSANATSVSIITPQASAPYPVTTVSAGFAAPAGILFDGTDIWMTDRASNKLYRLDALGGIMQTVNVGTSPREAVYDGANIWVPNVGDNSITVVQASTGAIVATIASNPTNKLNAPTSASFDGERILVTNTTGDSVVAFRAADLSFIANVDVEAASGPQGACSDGVNFWVPLPGASKLVRF